MAGGIRSTKLRVSEAPPRSVMVQEPLAAGTLPLQLRLGKLEQLVSKK